MRDMAIRDIEIALAVSTRQWSEHLHRFLVDHGGARVRLHVMQPEDAFSERFDVLVIDDICSFMSPRLVERLNRAGRRVVGVYSPAEFPDGKDRLLACGVTEVIEADAGPEEFLALVEKLEIDRESEGSPHHGREGSSPGRGPGMPRSLVAVGAPSGGCGATEVAIAVARRLAERCEGAALVDLDQRAPSVAQRLGLGLHPNLLTAIDAVHHQGDTLESCWHALRGSSLRVLPGVPNPTDRSRLRRGEVAEVLWEASRCADVTVANFAVSNGPVNDQPVWDVTGDVSDSVLEVAGMVVGVALPSPVGIVRIVEWTELIRARHPGVSFHLVVNRAPGSLAVRRALLEEVWSAVGRVPIAFLPEDAGVARAAWNGALVDRGRFRRGCDRLADRIWEEGNDVG